MPSIPVSRKELPESEPTAFGAARDGPRDVGQGQHSIHERETRVGGASAQRRGGGRLCRGQRPGGRCRPGRVP